MTPEEQAALDAAQEKQLRELAAQITQMSKLGFDPMTIRKGTVVSVADTATPPTVSLNISGSEDVLVSEVRTLNNYTPLVGQTVLIGKQGSEIFILGAIASINPKLASSITAPENGWIKATISNGSGADVYYRRVLDHGSWKMQWRGTWTTGGSTEMISSGDALDPDYRPASGRSLSTAREATDMNTCRIDFASDGTVRIWHSTPDASTGSAGSFSVGSHNHSHRDYYSATEFIDTATGSSGGFSVGNHSHSASITIVFPSWVSLNCEYFL